VVLWAMVLPASARSLKSDGWARSQFETAEKMRAALDEHSIEERTRGEYQKVVNAYRRVYFSAPNSTKADPSVVAVARLLTEMGRHFGDPDLLHSAIRQYELLEREYPGSRDRAGALFATAEIYQNDLKQKAAARELFEDFLRQYPRSFLAEEARSALGEATPPAAATAKEPADPPVRFASSSEKDDGARKSAASAIQSSEAAGSGASPRVTAVSEWSTPEYTRVSIELAEQLPPELKYRRQHISHPDRFFFDLLDTALVHRLDGRTIEVGDGLLKKIRLAQYQPGRTRIVLEVEDQSDCSAFLVSNPPGLMIDVRNRPLSHATAPLKPDRPVSSSENPAPGAAAASAPHELKEQAEAEPQPSSRAAVALASVRNSDLPKKVIVEADDDSDSSAEPVPPAPVATAKAAKVSPSPTVAAANSREKSGAAGGARRSHATSADSREAQPTASGGRSLTRALGLKIGKIVIDPGHGGHDTGTIGPGGLEEKELVLDVSRRLGKLLETRLGAEVVFTRKDDTFIPLETRTSIANQEQADLFVSVHANSSRDPDARGVETYYLNFTSSAGALEVAARENAVSESSIHELQDLVKKIALKEKVEESHEFASDVQQALHNGLAAKNPGVRDRGVKKAPFIVLIGANMPSILAEISFVSNPGDERHLETAEYRQRIAESLYRGISKYINGLSGVKVASRIEKTGAP
jgi:N-acetylmuramoyl-L-alanine amidase